MNDAGFRIRAAMEAPVLVLARCLAAELSSRQISVNAITLGAIAGDRGRRDYVDLCFSLHFKVGTNIQAPYACGVPAFVS